MSSDRYNTYSIYKGYKIYHPRKIDISGKIYYQYWPFHQSSIPLTGYPTKEEYYLAKRKDIDDKVGDGTWNDCFAPLLSSDLKEQMEMLNNIIFK